MLRKISILAVVLTLTLFSNRHLAAQISGATNGNPVIATGAAAGTSSPAYIDAYVASIGASGVTATDVCQRIQWVYGSASGLIPVGGSATVDARGFTGSSWSCSVNPFASGSGLTGKTGKLLLGYIDIPAQVTWIVPSHIIIEGLGGNGRGTFANSGANTVIHAYSTFTATNNALIQMGLAGTSAAITFGIQLRDLVVDCNDSSSATTGVLNLNSEEQSLLNDVAIFDCSGIALHVSTNQSNSPGHGAVNSGPYENVNINFSPSGVCSGCSSAIGLQVDGDDSSTSVGRSVRGFDNLTISGNYANCCSSGFGFTPVVIYGVSTALTNSHIEYCAAVCVQIGNNTTYQTYGVRISDVTIGNDNLNYDVEIYNPGATSPPSVGNILIENISHESINTHTIDDAVTSNTVPDNYVGWYWLGIGSSSSTTPAVFTSSNDMTTSSGNPFELRVPGYSDFGNTITKPSGSFKIDHPLDPANQYLYHSFVESPDMMNVYNGSVTTDKHGLATVVLPAYFEALNRDFRYQLTPVGQFAQAMVAQKVNGNRFVIKTSKPGVEVSWQVTGIRHDAYANQHRIPTEEQKPESLRQH
jgi:hypothetical protein